MLSFLGMILFMLAAIDAACTLAGWSLTAFAWSPLLFFVLGMVLVTLEALERDSKPSQRDSAGDAGRDSTVPIAANASSRGRGGGAG